MARQITDFKALILTGRHANGFVGNIVRAVQHAAQLEGLPVPESRTIQSGIGRSFIASTSPFLDGHPNILCGRTQGDDFRRAFVRIITVCQFVLLMPLNLY